MKLYSDFPARRSAQIFGDLVALTCIVISIWVAALVHAAIAVLAQFGQTIEDAGTGFQDTMAEAGELLGGVPLIGDGIRQPFDSASGAGTQLAEAGQAQQDLVMTAALIIAIVVAAIPILVVVAIWLRTRLAWARRATEVRNLSRLSDGPDLLALRALVNADHRELLAISDEPVDAWRGGDADVIRSLAQLELREAGVRLV